MERPMGPRAPGGDRNRAFETIFGRPSAVHHANQSYPQQQQHNGGGLQPGQSYSQRAPSPSGYGAGPSGPAGGYNAQGQPYRNSQQDLRYANTMNSGYGQSNPSQQLQNPYPMFRPGAGPQPGLSQPHSYAHEYPSNDYEYGQGRGPGYASSIQSENYSQLPPPSVRHSIQYRTGAAASLYDVSSDRGYPQQSSPPLPQLPPSQSSGFGGMTAAQAYKAQVDPRFSNVPNLPPGAAPPRMLAAGRASTSHLPIPSTMYSDSNQSGGGSGGIGPTNIQRTHSMQRVSSTSPYSQALPENSVPPVLPPVDGIGALEINDVLDSPRE